ncbi:MAG TPA: hypothetical protein VFF72_12455 [Caldimonas sp.]|nr:hypothetical protein [Caldimonas sp.]
MPDPKPQELSLVPIESEPPVGDAAPSTRRRGSAVVSLAPSSPSAPRSSERAHRGPGWFDSSWDLQTGCEVREGWPREAGLFEWIESWLGQPGIDVAQSLCDA